jgi:UDP:flavonoid glycosyltransferase YjiC (YdhE family)
MSAAARVEGTLVCITEGPDVTSKRLTVLFMPESAHGPTNNCVGIGDVLRRRGHRVVFAAEASWKGRLSPLGFDEVMVDLAPPAEESPDAGQFWKDFIRDSAPEFRRPTIEQLAGFMVPTWQALIDGAKFCQLQLQHILADIRPDIVVEDNVVCFPALVTAGVPFVRIVSCNPLEIPGPNVPPAYSGLPADDSSQFGQFREEYRRTHGAMWADFNTWVQEQGAPPLPDLEFIHTSDQLNLYIYPEAIDYTDRRPLNATWHRLDSSVRQTDARIELPDELLTRPDGSALIYLSLGSLGSADVDLMKRLIEVLADSSHRYIVSKGPRHSEYELPANMWGAEFLPQTRIMPLVDLLITHGGNNTITESFHFGKPTVVLPIFWDQHDNAQRVSETGYGVRLDTYSFRDDDLRDAITYLLGDGGLRSRLDVVGQGIRGLNGVATAAGHLEAAATLR